MTNVKQYDDLCEVFTDKLVAKIPSTATGVIREISFQGDDICPVGHSLFKIEMDDGVETDIEPFRKEQPSTPATVTASEQKEMTAPPGTCPLSKALSTPAVRHIAKKEGIDINTVPATGKGGRVTKGDILEFIAGGSKPAVTTTSEAHKVAPAHKIAALTGTTSED